ncbi:hypothetical protein ACFY36_04325 [Actinoplanes sp. NPDC000266]
MFAALTDYELRHLVGHLVAGGDEDHLHRLLSLPDGAGNAWFAAKREAGAIGDYADDLGAARRVAVADPSGLAHEVRYGLMTASLNSLARNLPPALLARAVDHGLWPAAQALRYAAQIPYGPLRAEAFALLAGRVDGRNRRDAVHRAVEAAESIEARPDWRLRAYAQIYPAAPDDLREAVLAGATATLAEIGRWEADENLAALLQAIPSARWPDPAGLTADKPVRPGSDNLGQRLQPWTHGARRMAALAPAAPDRLLDAMVEAARSAGEPAHRAILLAGCCGRRPELTDEARQALETVPDVPVRAEALAILAPHLPGPERRTRVRETALAVAEDPVERSRALTALAPLLPDEAGALRDALAAADGAGDEAKSYLLRFLGPVLPDDCVEPALRQAGTLSGSEWGRAMAALAPRLSREQTVTAIRESERIDDLYGVLGATVKLLAAGGARPDVVEDALRLALESGRASYLTLLAEVFNDDQFARVARAAVGFEDQEDARDVWRALADRVTSDRLVLLDQVADPASRVAARLALTPTGLDAGVLALAWTVPDPAARIHWAAAVAATGVPITACGTDVIEEALAAVSDAQRQAAAYACLLPVHPDPQSLVEAVLALAARAVKEQQPFREWLKANPPEPFGWAPSEFHPDRALDPLYGYLAREHAAAAFDLIAEVRRHQDRARALLAFAEKRPVAGADRFWEVAGMIDEVGPWIDLHIGVLGLLDGVAERDRLAAYVLGRAGDFPPGWRGSLLERLAPFLSEEMIEGAATLPATAEGAGPPPPPPAAGPDESLRRAVTGRWIELDGLLAYIEELPRPAVRDHLTAGLDVLTRGSRDDLAGGLASLSPLIRRVAGEDAPGDLAAELLRVVRWWP